MDLRLIYKAGNGLEAVDKVSHDFQVLNNHDSTGFKLILMDCNMPVMDGYEATRSIRDMIGSRGAAQPLIIAITGHTENMYLEHASKSGMDQVLQKPPDINVLAKVLLDLGLISEFKYMQVTNKPL